MKKRYYTYNLLLTSTDNMVKGELLTDKEMEKARKVISWYRVNPKTMKVSVPRESIYYFFGARFTTEESAFLHDFSV